VKNLTFSLLGVLALVSLTAGCFDTDKDDEPPPVFTDIDGVREQCAPITTTQDDHGGYGGYENSTASSGTIYTCTSNVRGITDSYYVRGFEFLGDGPRPKRIGVDTPLADETGKTPNNGGDSNWVAQLRTVSTSRAYNLNGNYTGYLSIPTHDGDLAHRDDYIPYWNLNLGDKAESDSEGREGSPPPAWTSDEVDGFMQLRIVEDGNKRAGVVHFMLEVTGEEHSWAVGVPAEEVSPGRFLIDHTGSDGNVFREAHGEARIMSNGDLVVRVFMLDAFEGERRVSVADRTVRLQRAE